ncbi:MAG: major facilitator superfamily 1 [Modestobacter sp.]|nr:major facilitator superfamily 1 [Modestobacter sp.]
MLGAAVIAVPLVRVSDRGGRRAGLALGYGIAVAGALLVVAAAAVSSLAGLLVGLFLPGLGWSCGVVAGSTMVTEAVPADLRPTA